MPNEDRLNHGSQAAQATKAHDEAKDALRRTTGERDELLFALKAVLVRPYGCPRCDSGTLRNKDKPHWDDCAFAHAQRIVARLDERREA